MYLMIDKTHINVFVDYSLSNLFGAIWSTLLFMFWKKGHRKSRDAWFVSSGSVHELQMKKYKKDFCLQALEDYISDTGNEHNYSIPQAKLKIIKSWPFIYWISDEFREKFKSVSIDKFFKVSQGCLYLMASDSLGLIGNFSRMTFLVTKIQRNVSGHDSLRGGPFKKWSGNLWLCVNWKMMELSSNRLRRPS